MAKKLKNKFAAVLLAAVMVFTALFNPSVFAETGASAETGPQADTQPTAEIKISDRQDWLEFAQNCRLDSYSVGLAAELDGDIDLTGVENISVPIFCGSFNGNGFTVNIAETDVKTDKTGLFRFLTKDAVVQNLNISAQIVCSEKDDEMHDLPIASELSELNIIKSDYDKDAGIGILCGENNGTILSCTVHGSLLGCENLGGIAGVNLGDISGCSSYAEIQGAYEVGGIAGINLGRISDCINEGSINVSPNEKATSVGGIAGVNENIIINCENKAAVGYLHTGYNVGGIAGLNRGFTGECTNAGTIFGRKDVGGITGQQEPHLRLEYGENILEMLDGSITEFSSRLAGLMDNLQEALGNGAEGLDSIVSQMSAIIKRFSGGISEIVAPKEMLREIAVYIGRIRTEIEYIKGKLTNDPEVIALLNEIEALLDELETGGISSWPRIISELVEKIKQLHEYITDYSWLIESIARITENVQNITLTVMNGMQDAAKQVSDLVKDLSGRASKLSKDISAFIAQTETDAGSVHGSLELAMQAVAKLQSSIKKLIQGSRKTVEDISKDVNAKEKGMTVLCRNTGDVSADYNVGGAVGNMSTELTLDQEKSEISSLEDMAFTNTVLFMRATIYKCENSGNINSKYDYTGGILGSGKRGAVVQCENCGNVYAGRNNAGGIAGYFRGMMHNSHSIGLLKGESYIGGIAGDADNIEECMAVPVIKATGAYTGAIAGYAESTENLKDNLFVNDEIGGVNGISYTDRAEAVSYEDLKNRKGPVFPKCFTTLKLCFNVKGEPLVQFSVLYGSKIENLPAVKQKDGKYWHWDEFDNENIRYNQIIDGEWKNLITTISSGEETPLFLAEGKFDERAYLVVKDLLPDTDNLEDDGAETETDDPERSAIRAFLADFGPLEDILATETQKPSSYKLTVMGGPAQKYTFRYFTEADGELYQLKGEEQTELSYTRDGRYIVFELDNGASVLFVPDNKLHSINWLMIGLIAGGVLILAVVIIIIAVTKHKKRKKLRASQNEKSAESQEKSAEEKSAEKPAEEKNAEEPVEKSE